MTSQTRRSFLLGAAAVGKALDTKEVQDKLAVQGCEILKDSPAQFSNLVKGELPKWGKIAKESGAKLD